MKAGDNQDCFLLFTDNCGKGTWFCDFTEPHFLTTCEITQSDTDGADWTRKRGETSSSNTGPSSGLSGSDDYYVYLEASHPAESGDAAEWVQSSLFTTDTVLHKGAFIIYLSLQPGGGDSLIRVVQVFGFSGPLIFSVSKGVFIIHLAGGARQSETLSDFLNNPPPMT